MLSLGDSFSGKPIATTSFDGRTVGKALAPLCGASSSLQDVFTQELSEAIAEQVQKQVVIPFVPEPVVLYVMTQAIQNLSSDLSSDMLEKVQELLEAESTETSDDDVSTIDRDALVDQVAAELNAKIDVPMFDEEQELEVLKQIMRVVFSIMTTSEGEARKEFINTRFEASRDLFSSEESRAKLVQAINAAVNVPFLGEADEESILMAAVGMCAETLQVLLTPEIIETLKGESPDGLLHMKQYLISTVNEWVDIVGLSEDQEKVLVETLVEILIDTYVDDTEAEFLLLSKDEQREMLEERCAIIGREMELSKRRYEREQQALAAKLERAQLRLRGIDGSSAPQSRPSRLRSFFRRN